MPSIPPPQMAPQPPQPELERQPPGLADDWPPWPTWSAPAAVALGFALGIFATVLVAVVAQIGGSSIGHPSPAVSIVGDVVFDLAFVAAALYFAFLRARPRPADFGFRRPPLRLAVKAFLAAGVGYYVLTAAYATLLGLHGNDKLPSELGVNRSTAALIGAAVFVCVIAPMAEEFFFRGFFFGALRHWRGPWVAAVLTGLLFGLAHTGSASSEYLIPLGFLGFVLCLVRWRTGSLYPCMALHATNNALALGINQLHWSVLAILALIAGANLVIAGAVWPLAADRSARTPGARDVSQIGGLPRSG
jgi:membrane protease YdiL (CAAX protease family)